MVRVADKETRFGESEKELRLSHWRPLDSEASICLPVALNES